MLLVAEVSQRHRIPSGESERDLVGLEKLKVVRSDIPAVTHIDYSARIQTVDRKRNEKFYRLIKRFYELTGCGVLVNTSFNVRGEPIVCSPEDAYICFMRTNIDYLAIGNLLLNKADQPPLRDDIDFLKRFELD
jgi:carbamoyltransferase